MRNLKKALSLVLALVFVLGLCTIGAGAAFTDEADIQYKEAITVLNGLGILEGYGDGKFGPLDNLTREQAAKMIAYMMLGEANAEKLINKQVFDDVAATRWSAKYIYFCYQKGIINGYGDGNFGPADNVTGTQLAKMLLCAAGYGCMGEYTGEGWDVNVFIDAVSEGIFEDANTVDYSAIATREEAALYVFNALTELDQVAYDVDMNKYDYYDAPFGYAVWELIDTAEDNLVHMVLENQATGADYTVITFVDENGEYTLNFNVETGLDLIGHDVNVYFKGDAKKDAEGVYYYEAYLVEDVSKVVNTGFWTYTIADLVKALGYPKTLIDDVNVFADYELAPYGYDDLAGLMMWSTDYYGTDTNGNLYMFNDDAKKAHTGLADFFGITGSFANFVLDAEGEILSYLYTNTVVAEVDSIEEGVINVDTNSFIGFPTEYYPVDTDEKEVACYSYAYEGMEEGDYVTIMKNGNLYTILPTTVVTATVNEIGSGNSAFNNRALSVALYTTWGNVTEAEWVSNMEVQLGYTYNFYMDATNQVFGIELVSYGESAGYVAVVEKFEVESKNAYASDVTYYYAQCVDGEGNEVIYQVEESEYNALPSTANAKGQEIVNAVYRVDTYTCITETDDAYGKSVVKFVADSYAVNDDADFDGNGTDLKVKGDYFADSANIFYVEGAEDLLLVTEVKAPGEEDDVAVGYVKDAAGTVTTLWIFEEAPVIYADSYIYVTAQSGYDAAQGKTALGDYYSLYIDGVFTTNITVKADAGSLTPTFYIYTVDTDGIYDLEMVENYGDHSGDEAYVESIAISKVAKNLYKGMLSGIEFDDVDVSGFTVVNESKDTNPATGKYYVCNDVDDIASLIAKDLTVTVSVVVVEDAAGDRVPTGVIYVTDIA